jgi:molecular chaperone GrpE
MKSEETEAKTRGAAAEAGESNPAPEGAGAQATGAEAAGSQATGAPATGAGPAQPDGLAQLQAELEKTRAVVAEQYDKYLRLQAEFENFKKRMLREQAEQLKFAQLPLLRDLTAVMDDLERALQHGRGDKVDAAAVISGVEMVAKQMGDTFQRYGMARVSSAKQPFDPVRHQAVSVVETGDLPENHVIEEFRPGYVMHDRVVRPAMVSVSKKTVSNPAVSNPTGGNGVAKES